MHNLTQISFNRTVIFPYGEEFAPVLNILMQQNKLGKQTKLLSPSGWGLGGCDAGEIFGRDNYGIEILEDSIEVLDGCECFIAAPFHEIKNDKVSIALNRNINVHIEYAKSVGAEVIDLRNYHGSTLSDYKKLYEKYRYEKITINTPVIYISGVIEHLNKLDLQAKISALLSQNGYQVGQISSSKYSKIMGMEPFPEFMTASIPEEDKIEGFRYFLTDFCEKENPDIVIISLSALLKEYFAISVTAERSSMRKYLIRYRIYWINVSMQKANPDTSTCRRGQPRCYPEIYFAAIVETGCHQIWTDRGKTLSRDSAMYVNASDLIALTVLQVFEPNIYKELYGVGLQFCGSIPLYIGMQQDANKKKVAESYAEILEKFAIKKEATGNLLEILFPKISQCLDRYYYAYNHEKMMIEKRICIEKCFYSYFTFNLIDEILVSLIHRILFEASEDEFDSLVETFSSEGKIEDIVITADALLHQFKETDKYKEKMPLIFKRISNNWKFFSKEEEPKGLFSLPVDWRTCKLLESALYIIKSKEERCRSILELFSGEELSLELCVFLYRVLEKPFTKEDFHDDETSLIDKATIEKLKNVLKDRIRVRMENQSIRTLNNYDNIIYFLEDIDGMLLKEFLACCAGDELSLAGVISTFAL